MMPAMASPEMLRRLDRVLGGIACRILACCGARRKPAAFPAAGRRDVLVMQLAEMGSMVLALPALGELRQRMPDVRLHFLVMRESRALIDALHLAPPERVHALDFSSTGSLLGSLRRALGTCRRAHLAAAIHFDFFAQGHAAFAALACPQGERVGFDNGKHGARRALLTRPVMYSAHHHTADMFSVLVRSLFLPPDTAPFARIPLGSASALPDYKPDAADLHSVKGKLGANAEKNFFLVSANASDRLALRRWPLTRFAQATRDWLEAHNDWHAVLIGTDSDRMSSAEVAAAHCDITDLTGRTTFGELLALMSAAKLLLCNDSGPAHFASLARLPSVVLFGPETPRLYAPLGGRAECLHADFACSPCVSAYNDKSSDCPRSLCLEHIQVDAVLAAMERAAARA
ncbi:MAG: glycosyltransferase family 9 protein [Sphaerospermopsis kisseleviana]